MDVHASKLYFAIAFLIPIAMLGFDHMLFSVEFRPYEFFTIVLKLTPGHGHDLILGSLNLVLYRQWFPRQLL